MGDKILNYYSRKDIQKAIFEEAKDKEVAVKFADKGFGKRPDMLQFNSDVFEFAKQGATSFHASEERWQDPLKLVAGMTKAQLDELRKGFDYILDIDCKFLDYSKITAALLIEALKFHNISENTIGIKFSGNRSFHIAIPFEAFPSNIHSQETRLLFPDAPRIITLYLKNMIKEPLKEKILELSKIEELAKIQETKDSSFDPFSLIEIDTALISSRHMYRMPYSLNEKSGLISIPIKISQIKDFKLSQARIENVETGIKFIDSSKIAEPEASELIIQAFDQYKKQIEPSPTHSKTNFSIPQTAIAQEYFPPCIKLILSGLKTDGRKRSLFILINFLRHVGYSLDELEKMILEWNKKNYEPLRENYILAQLSWHKRQKLPILPPNCTNESYYKSLGICHPDNWCKLIKNPVNYTKRRLKVLNENKPKRKTKKTASKSF